MKTPLSWLNIYTPIADLIAEKGVITLAHEYSIHTAEIDDIIPHFIDKVVVGKVISCEKHPDSKKLSIVRVNLGEHGEETILTGAENIVNATYVPVAMVGAELDGGNFVIGERKMAGMMSRGMICAEDEIGLVSTRADGIMELEKFYDEDYLESMIGKSFFDLTFEFLGKDGEKINIPLRDTTFEIDNKFITNRPDLFSVVGNAREWGAVFGKNFEEILPTDDDIISLSDNEISVKIESEKCLAYSLLEVKNLTAEKSPLGTQIMMERAGLSPKLDLIDVTNLILTEYGQPMHAFDADKIVGKISVRMAKNGEKILALNNVEYSLTDADLVIADENGPVAIAGVIGGLKSAVSETTTRVFFESATFDAVSVRLTAQRHAIRTDASTRYEKSLDPTLAGKTFSRVMEYLKFFGKNPEIVGQFGYLTENYNKNISVIIPKNLISKKAGIEIPEEKIFEILTNLGFQVEKIDILSNFKDAIVELFVDKPENDAYQVFVPSWRATKDISIAEDIVEEILRVYGYENIPAIPLSGDFTIQEKNREKALYDELLAYFSHKNFSEIYNYSFTNTPLQEKFLQKNHDHLIAIQNAYTEDFTHMRDSLAPRLFASINANLRHSDHLQFFEMGKIYAKNISHDQKLKNLLSTQESLSYPEKLMIGGVSTADDIASLRAILDTFFAKIFTKNPIISQ